MSEIVAAWGKSKCGAMRWLVPLVAPLLILPKRWLVLSFVCLFNVCTVVHRVTANVPALGEVVDKKSLNFRFITELCKYKTNFKLSLKPHSSQTPVTSCVYFIPIKFFPISDNNCFNSLAKINFTFLSLSISFKLLSLLALVIITIFSISFKFSLSQYFSDFSI